VSPGSAGEAFRLPPLRVLPSDTNVLRSEVLRRARRVNEPASRMLTAARSDSARILTTPHVIEEMDRDIHGFARDTGVDPERAAAVWEQECRPEIVVVDVRDLIGAMAGHPLVAPTFGRHPQDAPFAVLCALLGVRGLSEDPDLAQVATGRAWLSHVIAVTDAGRADIVLVSTGLGGELTVRGAVTGARRAYGGLQKAVGPTAASSVVLGLALLVFLALLHEPTRQRLVSSPPVQFAGRAARELGVAVLTTAGRGAEGEAFLSEKALPDDANTLPVAKLVQHLAGARSPRSTDELARLIGQDRDTIEIMLDRHACFRPTADGVWQLGHRLGGDRGYPVAPTISPYFG